MERISLHFFPTNSSKLPLNSVTQYGDAKQQKSEEIEEAWQNEGYSKYKLLIMRLSIEAKRNFKIQVRKISKEIENC